jgi:hypothetical protein
MDTGTVVTSSGGDGAAGTGGAGPTVAGASAGSSTDGDADDAEAIDRGASVDGSVLDGTHGGDAGDGAAGSAEMDAADASPPCPKPDGGICHEFLANDNARNVVQYVNEFDPTKDWTSPKLGSGPNTPESIEIVDNPNSTHQAHKAVLVSVERGFTELDLATGKILRPQTGYTGIRSASRLPDGYTGLAVLDRIIRSDPAGNTINSILLPPGSDLGPVHRNPADGSYWFSKSEMAYAIDGKSGAISWKADIGAFGHEHRVFWRDGGGAFVSKGMPPVIVELDARGQTVAEVGGKTDFPFLDFVAGFVRLPNGNFVAANYLAHLSDPGFATPQIVELTPDNRLTWQFGDQNFARQIVDVYVLR